MAKSWESFVRAVMPRNAPAVQRQEMRRAFYAGAWAMLCAFREIGEDSVSEDEGVAVMERLKTEVETFYGQVRKGRA